MISRTYITLKSLFIRGFCALIILLAFSNGTAQENTNQKKILKQARKAMFKEQYKAAQVKYLQLINAEPKNSVYNFEAGLSYLYSTHERTKSIPFLEAYFQHIKEDEDTIPEAYYFLAKAYQLNSEFEKSNTAYSKFNPYINNNIKPGKELEKEVATENFYNKNGVKYLAEKNNNTLIKNIGTNINSTDREYAPVLFKSQNVLLFTSRRKGNGNKIDRKDLLPYEDIYVAKKTDQGWVLLTDNNELKRYLPANVNTKKHDASITYSTDEKTLYTYKKDAIWQSTYSSDSWSALTKLNPNVNASKFNVPSVTLTPDGNTLFIVSERKEGMGGRDIYKSTKSSAGDWEEPVLLSNNINTDQDEDGPFLTEDGKTLYFSSKGHSSIGGYDIFKSEMVDGQWSAPINLGIPINSPADDIFYVTDPEQKNGFFSSSREGGHGSMDIYAFSDECENLKNTEIKGIVYHASSKLPLSSKLTLHDLSTNQEINTTTSKDGKFLLVAPPENNYQLVINTEGYKQQTISITLPKQCDYYQPFTEIALDQIQIDSTYYQIASVKNSFFNTGEEINNYKKTGTLETNLINNELPFVDATDQEIIAFSRTIDPNQTELNYSVINDTLKIDQLTDTQIADETLPSFEDIHFDFDQSTLNNNHKKMLNELIEYLKSEEGKNIQLTISGHTDGKRDLELNKKIFAKRNIPFTKEAAEKRSKEYNVKLSEKRAHATAKYLISKGVKKANISVTYYGEEKPLAPNTNVDGSENLKNQALNRRVSFSLDQQNIL